MTCGDIVRAFKILFDVLRAIKGTYKIAHSRQMQKIDKNAHTHTCIRHNYLALTININ